LSAHRVPGFPPCGGLLLGEGHAVGDRLDARKERLDGISDVKAHVSQAATESTSRLTHVDAVVPVLLVGKPGRHDHHVVGIE
jgi:hypothetical protein